jgi:hypothetical protein
VAWTSFKVDFARLPNDWQANGEASLKKKPHDGHIGRRNLCKELSPPLQPR